MIELDPSQKAPLYEQLYAALADEIRTGQRAAGTPLPGRRTMAAQQGVSVNTVDTAYQMLAAEGLAEARPRSGFYVQSTYGMLHSRARRTPPPRCRRPLHRRVLCRCMTCPPAVWTRRCSRRTAGGASRKNCSTSDPSFYSAARCRAMRRCGRRSPNICRCTAAWTAHRNKSSSAQVLSTCWAAWRTCSMMGWRPSKTPDTPARGRSCRTAASPARWWTSTVRAYPPTRWKRAARTSAT